MLPNPDDEKLSDSWTEDEWSDNNCCPLTTSNDSDCSVIAPEFSPVYDSPKNFCFSPASPSLDPCSTVLLPEHLLTTEMPVLELSAGLPSPTPVESTTLDVNTDMVNLSSVESSTHHEELKTFKVVIDNLDMNVKSRFMRVNDHRNNSLHYINSYAVQSRIDFSTLPDTHPATCLNSPANNARSLLPSADDDKSLFTIHVSRILFTHMKFFQQSFDGVVPWHLKHNYHKEMSKKSVVVPLGVLLKNENLNSDMLEIMAHFHQYVPAVESSKLIHVDTIDEPIAVPQAAFHKILLGGDQLTVARARSAMKQRINSPSPTKRMAGFIPAVEDWHTQTILMEVIWKYYYSNTSASDHGTLYQLRNVINRSNVSVKTKGNFNSCDDFLVLVITCYVLAAAMEHLNINSLDEVPAEEVVSDAAELWALPAKQHEEKLDSISSEIVNKFIPCQFNCAPTPQKDQVFEYSRQLLSVGMLYIEYADAIREGDGERVHRCWKYLLPIFKSAGRTNYSIEAVTLLNQYEFRLTPRQSAELMWGRFINVHGVVGRNIPCDLHMEHLNRICKGAVYGLQANKTPGAIKRVGKSLGTLNDVLEQYDKDNDMKTPSGIHHRPCEIRDRDMILRELVQASVLSRHTGRSHTSYPRVKVLLHPTEEEILINWMIQHMKQ